MGQITVNGRLVDYSDEKKNLLEVIRSAGVDLPTFCYHPSLSVYGGCRMCIVEVEGMGIVASCSTQVRDGMKVRTHTKQLRKIRKLNLELLLANHDRECTTCAASNLCKLQDLANRLGIKQIRFGHRDTKLPIDQSGTSIIRDPNKCILCGECVRMCEEVQKIGVLAFANRGSKATVTPAFEKELKDVECVNCGQCLQVCPTGALTVKSEIDRFFHAVSDPDLTVVVQIAPAVRVALGEAFGLPGGENVLGKLVNALKQLGADKVFDTSFAADLTVLEESEELISRVQKKQNLPLFTSCCPAWVKYAEQYYPEFLPHLSTCRSPQQMFGSLIKTYYAEKLNLPRKNIFVVSIMPCTAKKFECTRPEFAYDEDSDVDLVLTTQETAAMIKEEGIDFARLEVESMDMPLSFATGAGIVFGNSGGVSEAVLRYAADRLSGTENSKLDYYEVRGNDGIKTLELKIGEVTLRLGVVHTLGKAKELIEQIKAGDITLDVVEVMACPGGCVAGGGQPKTQEQDAQITKIRTQGLYNAEKMAQIRKSQDNPVLAGLYKAWLDHPNSSKSHKYLHTHYHARRRLNGEYIEEDAPAPVEVEFCLGTSCYLAGAYQNLKALTELIEKKGLAEKVHIKGTFCFENCQGAPSIKIDGKMRSQVRLEDIPGIVEEIASLVDKTQIKKEA
jgi:NADH-quinone oxidoreductase subunit G